jgi:hypothetical protein
MQASKKQAGRRAPVRPAPVSRLGPAAGVELQEARRGLLEMQALRERIAGFGSQS